MATLRCQFCGCELDDEVVLCQSCSTPHHKDCFECNGICTTYACGSSSYVPAQNGTLVQQSTAEITSLAQKINPTSKSLVTPGFVRIEHTYHNELGRHKFNWRNFGANRKNISGILPISVVLGLMVLLVNPLMAIGLVVVGYFVSLEKHDIELFIDGELVIDQNYIKFIFHEDPEGMFKAENFITVNREDIEGVRLLNRNQCDGKGYYIEVKAKNKVRHKADGTDDIELQDTMEIELLMRKKEAKWLYECIMQLATAKKV